MTWLKHRGAAGWMEAGAPFLNRPPRILFMKQSTSLRIIAGLAVFIMLGVILLAFALRQANDQVEALNELLQQMIQQAPTQDVVSNAELRAL